MDLSGSSQANMSNLASTVQQLQRQLNEANAAILSHRGELQIAAQKISTLESGKLPEGAKIHKPAVFNGKGSVASWASQMENYLGSKTDDVGLHIALSYLQSTAHEWWMVFKETDKGQLVNSWSALKKALVERFETLNKTKIARDKLAKWKQIKDVTTFNEDFQKILLDIPGIGDDEKIDRYTRGLKPYIWRELCTKEYTSLSDAMRDAERVESAYRRVQVQRYSTPRTMTFGSSEPKSQLPVPMEIGNVELQKLSKEERDKCMREGLCLRCRQKGHLAKNCPKGRRN